MIKLNRSLTAKTVKRFVFCRRDYKRLLEMAYVSATLVFALEMEGKEDGVTTVVNNG